MYQRGNKVQPPPRYMGYKISRTTHHAIETHQSGKDHKDVSKALGLQRTTVSYCSQTEQTGNGGRPSGGGRPTKRTRRERLMQEVTKEPRQHQKTCRPHEVSVHDSDIKDLHESSPAVSKEQNVSRLSKTILMILQTLRN